MRKRNFLLTLAMLGSLTSCEQIVKQFDDGPKVIYGDQSKPTSIVFSHNVNGETHPCGCRHHPLGGLPQVAGQIEKIKKTRNVIFIDSGDLLFPSSKVPKTIVKSKSYAAKNLVKGLDQMGLTYFTPGDQDLALGFDFIADISKGRNYKILMANYKGTNPAVKFTKWDNLQIGPDNIFITGIVEPSLLQSEFQGDFHSPIETLKNVISEIKKKGFDEKNPLHHLIVVSHSGQIYDEKLAKKFPMIDWIIGSHSQSFLREPVIVGQTKIGQVLSRNHYLGEIQLNANKKDEAYFIHEMRDEVAKELPNNPYFAFIDKHKEEVQKKQKEEQKEMFSMDIQTKKFDPPTSCKDCHNAQYDFWAKTPHSIAFGTLIQANEQYNTDCIKCHSVGLFNERGFSSKDSIVLFNEKDPKKLDQIRKSYWNEVDKAFKGLGSIRELAPKKVEGVVLKLEKLDLKHKVTHNFANVQCLNCHETHQEHPFTEDKVTDFKARKDKIKKMCLTCHDPDQSPSWYEKDSKGLARKISDKDLEIHYKKVSCPTMDESERL